MTYLSISSLRLRKLRTAAALLLATGFLFWQAGISVAHPLGNFTVNRYSRLDLDTNQITLTYVVDMAEIPTQQERSQIDADGDGRFSPTEQMNYLAQLLPTLQAQLRLEINDEAQMPNVVGHELSFPEGQAGLPTMRLKVQYVYKNDSALENRRATFVDGTFEGRLGWQEVVVRGGDGVELLLSNVPSQDLSQELTAYPENLLQSPPSVNRADFEYRLLALRNPTNQSMPAVEPEPIEVNSLGIPVVGGGESFSELIELTDLGPWALFVALLAAFGWGAAHALSPGHGKTIVGAYLVGSRGTAKHALFLGLTTTITHTAGVFALGLITLFASQYILPETLFPWLTLLSGILVAVIGLSMAWGWLRGLLKQSNHAHEHSQDHHHHDHEHQHDHHHRDGHHHVHQHPGEEHHGEMVMHGATYHRHGIGAWHSHNVPGQDGDPITWRSLLALGISGGLLPCPSALVVMLGAIALQRIVFGLVLIIAFSLGLAGVLTAFGLALIYAGKLFARLPESGRVLKMLPVASALFITAVGVGITWQAVSGL